MLTIDITLEFVTGWKVRMPLRLSVQFCISLLFAMVFFPLSAQITLGQGLLKLRSQGDDKQTSQKTEQTQNDADAVTIPWSSLDERSKRLIREVAEDKTFVRHLPRQVGYCDLEMYDFMISHPDVVVELWDMLGETQISLKETGLNKYLLKEGTATTSQVEVLYKSENLCIVYALGEYEATLGPLMRRKIKGDVILILKSRYGWDKDNRPVVQSDLDAYVRIHNPGAEMLAKMLLPIVGKIADSNFEQSVGFVMNISDAAQEDFEPLQELALRLKNVRPEVVEEFAFVSEAVFDREVDRYVALASASQQTLSDLVYPLPPSVVESSTLPKYTAQPDLVVKPQEQTFHSNPLSLSASPMSTNHFDESLIPPTAREIRRETTQNRVEATSDLVFETDDSWDETDLDALMRSFQGPGLVTPRENPSMNDLPAQPLRTLTIVNDGRTINDGTTNSNAHTPSTIPTLHGSSLFQQKPTDGTRVVIGAIAPSASSVVSRETTFQRQPSSVATVPSPTRFGTSTPIIPRPLSLLRSQTDVNADQQ